MRKLLGGEKDGKGERDRLQVQVQHQAAGTGRHGRAGTPCPLTTLQRKPSDSVTTPKEAPSSAPLQYNSLQAALGHL